MLSPPAPLTCAFSEVAFLDDAVGVTRYPPALASAFEKAIESARISHNARTDHLWMIGSGIDSVQPEMRERVDALREL